MANFMWRTAINPAKTESREVERLEYLSSLGIVTPKDIELYFAEKREYKLAISQEEYPEAVQLEPPINPANHFDSFCQDQVTKGLTPNDAVLRFFHENRSPPPVDILTGRICKCTASSTHERVDSRGSNNPDLFFIGESPGDMEARKGLPFCGPAGNLLDRIIAMASETKYVGQEVISYFGKLLKLRWGNTVLCPCLELDKTTRRRKPRPPKENEVGICVHNIEKEIRELRPKVIILLGGVAVRGFRKEAVKITKIRGQIWKVHVEDNYSVIAIPALHPAAILRGMQDENSISVSLLNLVDDIRLAFNIASLPDDEFEKVGVLPERENYTLITDAEQLFDLIEKIIDDYRKGKIEYIGYDLETNSISPYEEHSDIIGVGISFKENSGIYVVTPKVSESDKTIQRESILNQLKRLCDEVPMVMHNAKFDLQFSQVCWGFRPKHLYGDTMLAHYLVYGETKRHGLKKLAAEYFYLPPYQEIVSKYFDSNVEDDDENVKLSSLGLENAPLEDVAFYGAIDSDVTLRLHNVLQEQIKELSLETPMKLLLDASQVVTDIEISGITVDELKRKELEIEYPLMILGHYLRILQSKEIQKWALYKMMKSLASTEDRIAVKVISQSLLDVNNASSINDVYSLLSKSEVVEQFSTFLQSTLFADEHLTTIHGMILSDITESDSKSTEVINRTPKQRMNKTRLKRVIRDTLSIFWANYIFAIISEVEINAEDPKWVESFIKLFPPDLRDYESLKKAIGYNPGSVPQNMFLLEDIFDLPCEVYETSGYGSSEKRKFSDITLVNAIKKKNADIGLWEREKIKLSGNSNEQTRAKLDKWIEDDKEAKKVLCGLYDIKKINKVLTSYVCTIPDFYRHWSKVGSKILFEEGVSDSRLLVTVNYLLHGTDTGRWSTRNYSLHTTPKGSDIQRLFVSRWNAGGLLLSCDYSQLELTVLAEETGDPSFRQAVIDGQDIHKMVASQLFNKSIDEVTKDERQLAKTFNFALVYGSGDNTMAENAGITVEEVRQQKIRFYELFPKVEEWIENRRQDALERGMVRYRTGRIRRLPSALSLHEATKEHGLRQAQNSPIQGTAGDLTHKALISLYGLYKRKEINSVLIGEVHDQIITDVYPGELWKIFRLKKEAMEVMSPEFYNVTVPVRIDFDLGVGLGYGIKAEFVPDEKRLILSGREVFMEKLLEKFKLGYDTIREVIQLSRSEEPVEKLLAPRQVYTGFDGGSWVVKYWVDFTTVE